MNPELDQAQQKEVPPTPTEPSQSPSFGLCGTYLECPWWPIGHTVSWSSGENWAQGARVGYHQSDAGQYASYMWTAQDGLLNGLFFATLLGGIVVFLIKVLGGLFR